MPLLKICTKARADIEKLRSDKDAFTEAYNRAILSGLPEDVKEARERKQELLKGMEAVLREQKWRASQLSYNEFWPYIKSKENYKLQELVSDDPSHIEYVQMLDNDTVLTINKTGKLRILSKCNDSVWCEDDITEIVDEVDTFHVLADGRLVVNGAAGVLKIGSKSTNGTWKFKELTWTSEDSERSVHYVIKIEELVDGRIVSVDDFDNMRIWTEDSKGKWTSVEFADNDPGSIFKPLSDGRFITTTHSGIIKIWYEDSKGVWIHEKLNRHKTAISDIKVFPDGRIVSLDGDGVVYIWKKNEDGKWIETSLDNNICVLGFLRIFPDNRIVVSYVDDYDDYYGEIIKISIYHETVNVGWKSDHSFDFVGALQNMEVLPDGRIVTLDLEGSLDVWSENDDRTWECNTPENAAGGTSVFQILHDGRILVGHNENVGQNVCILDGDEVA